MIGFLPYASAEVSDRHLAGIGRARVMRRRAAAVACGLVATITTACGDHTDGSRGATAAPRRGACPTSAIVKGPFAFGDGGPADRAVLELPDGVAVAANGAVYVQDSFHRRIRRVDPDGTIVTVAGTGRRGRTDVPPTGCAVDADLIQPAGMVLSGDGSVYFRDANRVVRVAPEGTIAPVVTTTPIKPGVALAVDRDGNVLIADGEYKLVRIDAGGVVHAVAGIGEPSSAEQFSGDGGPATSARFRLSSAAGGPDGSVYITDAIHVMKVAPDGIIHHIAGLDGGCTAPVGSAADGIPAMATNFCGVDVAAIGQDGSVYVLDRNRVRRIGSDQMITTVAGSPGEPGGFAGDGARAVGAQLNFPRAAAVDQKDVLYIADYRNHRIRRVGADGGITTFAGSGAVTPPNRP